MKHVPNVLSFSRIPLAFIMLWMGVTEHWTAATLLLLVSLLTDVLDGAVAYRFNVVTDFGESIAEPVCDGILATSAILALTLTGVWSWWSFVFVGAIAVGLQSVHQMDLAAQKRPGYDQSLIKRLKRHQYYIHPYFFVIVIMMAAFAFIGQASEGWTYLAGFLAVSVSVIFLKRKRVLQLMAGPTT